MSLSISGSLVQRDGSSHQFGGGHLFTRNQVEHLAIVSGYDGGAAPVDVVGRRFRSELVHTRRASSNLRVAPS